MRKSRTAGSCIENLIHSTTKLLLHTSFQGLPGKTKSLNHNEEKKGGLSMGKQENSQAKGRMF